MVLTVLEAHVQREAWPVLEDAYKREITSLEEGIVQTFLLHSTADPTIWRIATWWRDRAALEAMRLKGQTPTGIRIFRMADAEPSLTLFEVVAGAGAIKG